jgi:hypothetical protein
MVALVVGFPTLGDVILARNVLPSTEAGLYAGVALVGRMELFLMIAVTSVFYPRFVAASNGDAWIHLRSAATLLGGLLAMTLLVVMVFPNRILDLAVGGEFSGQADELRLYAGFIAVHSLAALVLYFRVGEASGPTVRSAAGCGADDSTGGAVPRRRVGYGAGSGLPGRVGAVPGVEPRRPPGASPRQGVLPVSALSTIAALTRSWVFRAVLASLILAIVIVPADVWGAPDYDRVYSGFDPITMYTSPSANEGSAASVAMSASTLVVTAGPRSDSAVHLFTGPFGHELGFEAKVREADEGTTPLRISTWAPYTNNRLDLVFEADPRRRILEERYVDGVLASTTPLGVYSKDQAYRFESDLDRDEKTAAMRLSTVASDVIPGPALRLVDDGEPFESHVISSSVPVEPGEIYSVDAVVRDLGGGVNGLSIEWLDADGERISISSDWIPANPADGWRGRRHQAAAPDDASTARVEVAVSDSGESLFAEVGLFDDSEQSLLADLPLEPGSVDWRRAEGVEPLEFREFPTLDIEVAATGEEWPELFAPTRMALSVGSSSIAGFADFEVSDYEVRLVHQRWLAVQVDDPLLTALVGSLGALAVLTIGVAVSDMWRRRRGGFGQRLLAYTLPTRPQRIVASVSVAAYAIVNGLLSQQSSLNVDIVSARIWAYTVSKFGLADIYYAPNIASAGAGQWQGLPLQEAGFPYGPVMAYITAAQGYAYRFFIAPVVGTDGALVLDVMAKFANTLFGVLAAFLVLLIARQAGASPRTAGIVGLLVLLNPALWVAGSVWGSSQNLSVVFLLGAVLATMRTRPSLAWFLLALALMTRPQNMFPGALLAVWLLRSYPIRLNLRAMSTAAIATFVVLLPFALTISPTLPVDNVYNALFLHAGDGNDAWTLPLSWGTMSIWPVVVLFRYSVDGVDRILFPATADFLGDLTYYSAGTILVFGTVALLAGQILIRQRRGLPPLRLRVMMATAAMALMILRTGTPSYHIVLALILIVASWGQLSRRAYIYSVGAVTVSAVYGMYGMGAYWLTAHPNWSVGVFDDQNPVAAFAARSVNNDWAVTAAVLLNLSVFLLLVGASLRRTRTPVTDEPSPSLRGSPSGDDTPTYVDQPPFDGEPPESRIEREFVGLLAQGEYAEARRQLSTHEVRVDANVAWDHDMRSLDVHDNATTTERKVP